MRLATDTMAVEKNKMALDLKLSHESRGTTLKISGQLDSNTAAQMIPVIDQLKRHPPNVLILELKDLTYISSAGLRCIFQMKKLVNAELGRLVVNQPTPQVQKVFDIIKVVPVQSIFASTAELDAYLDKMQRKVTDEDQ